MTYSLYSLRDQKGDFYAPKVYQNEPSAVREIAMLVNDSTSGVLSFAPRDFTLYEVGQFDSEKGLLVPVSPCRFVVNCADLVGVLYEK